MKLFLVDDNEQFRANLKLYLEGQLHHKVIGEVSDGSDFMNANISSSDIVLMDINMPGINGIEATKRGVWKNRNIKIIAVSQHLEIADLKILIGAGFKGFVSKTRVFEEMEDALIKVSKDGYSFPDYVNLI